MIGLDQNSTYISKFITILMAPLLFWGGLIPKTGAVAMIFIAFIFMTTVMTPLLFWGGFILKTGAVAMIIIAFIFMTIVMAGSTTFLRRIYTFNMCSSNDWQKHQN